MQKTNLVAPIIGLVAFAFIFSACQPKATPAETPSPTESQQMMEKESDAASATKGKTITEKETYQSPAGPEEVGFTIVVDDGGVITEAKTEELAKAPISKVRQSAFAKELSGAVVGKKLSELSSVDRIGGSSLTTGAFNKFLENAKKQI